MVEGIRKAVDFVTNGGLFITGVYIGLTNFVELCIFTSIHTLKKLTV